MSVSQINTNPYSNKTNNNSKTNNNINNTSSIDNDTNNINNEEESQDIKNYAAIFHQKMIEMSEKYRRGETEQKIQIGLNAYTVKEWKKLLTSFDKVQVQIREEIEEEIRIRMEKKHAEEIRKKLENISDSEIAALVEDKTESV